MAKCLTQLGLESNKEKRHMGLRSRKIAKEDKRKAVLASLLPTQGKHRGAHFYSFSSTPIISIKFSIVSISGKCSRLYFQNIY